LNNAILDSDVQQFIREHSGKNLDRLLFGKSQFPRIGTRELAVQIESRKRCEKKLPSWYATPGIYYPPRLSIEQSSSELTAAYKSRLLRGDTVIDLTGGMGVDAAIFAKVINKVIHCELDAELSGIAAHNARALGIHNCEFLSTDGPAYLSATRERFGTVYIDPSRRAGASKVFRLSDCIPDVTTLLNSLLEKSERVLIKTSPLLDIRAGLAELRHVSEIHIVSVKNECKELLWVCGQDAPDDPEIVCTALDGRNEKQFSFFPGEEASAGLHRYSPPLAYLYEPDAALFKAGCFRLIALRYGLEKLERHSHLYTSGQPTGNFPGKLFHVNKTMTYKEFSRNPGLKKANLVVRNFPLSAEELRKKHRLSDGGDDFLFFTTIRKNQLTVVVCRRAG
jgi:16S rRNA G966 N2-methylase RsmD